MLKRRKGEIATLLTLGLVILGGVLAIGSSVFLSQQKTTSTRAAGECGSGNAWPCPTDDISINNCKTPSLEFGCCVLDTIGCSGENNYRVRWYGCTGQPCGNTKINNTGVGGKGYLESCPHNYREDKCVLGNTPNMPTATPATPTTCKIPGFGTIPRDGKVHCIPEVTAYAYAMCSGQNTDATISHCTNGNPCRAGGGTGTGNDGCLASTTETTPSSPTNTPTSTQKPDDVTEILTPTVIATEKPVPAPSMNPSTNCTNQECADPNLGVWYSYKCVSIPQEIRGVTQCPAFDFYKGKNCNVFAKSSFNFDNIKQNFCNAPYISLYAKRDVLITYTINQTRALDIYPIRPIGTFSISNNFGLLLFSKSITIGKDTFPIKDTITVKTGSNVIYAYFSYPNLKNQIVSLPSLSANVFNGKADISIDIK